MWNGGTRNERMSLGMAWGTPLRITLGILWGTFQGMPRVTPLKIS